MDVLIAEDNPTSRLMLEEWVSAWGYQPLLAADGEAAWQLLKNRSQPCLALIDWMMPGIDGLELCHRLKTQHDGPFVYILLLTGRNVKADVVTGLDAGADDFLSKPIQPDELRSRLAVGDRILGYQEALSERNAQLQTLLTGILGIVLFKDAEGRWLEANAYTLKLFGLPPEWRYQGLRDKQLAQFPGAHKALLHNMLEGDQEAWERGHSYHEEWEIPNLEAGTTHWYDVIRTPLYFPDGQRRGLALLGHDITLLKLLEEQLRYAAYHDALTGLFSRRYFQEHLQKSMDFSRRSQLPLTLCLCDVDDFRSLNARHGHETGDRVLSQLGSLIQHQLRNADMAGRFGGDEFCIAFPGTSMQQSLVCLNRIREHLRSLDFQASDGSSFQVTLSFGMAELNEQHTNSTDLLKLADKALYRARQLGHNQLVVYVD